MSRRSRRQQRAEARAEKLEPQHRPLRQPILISIALFISVAMVYGQVATHDFVNLDDPVYVTQNNRVTSGLSMENVRWALSAFHATNWHPLAWISHMIDVQLFGLDAGKHLIVNLVLHGLSTALLFLLLHRLTNTLWPSATVAALFALHPLHVESVAWVSERKDVLSVFFFLLTLWMYADFVEKRTPARHILTIVVLVLGLMSKPMLVTLPFVLLLFDWWPLRRFSIDEPRKLGPLVIEKLPMFAPVVPVVLLTLTAQKEAIGTIPFSERLANAAQSYVVYLGKMFWPAHLAIIYPLPHGISPSRTIAAVVVLTAVTVIVLRFSRRFPFLPWDGSGISAL